MMPYIHIPPIQLGPISIHILLVLLLYTPVRFGLDFLRAFETRHYGLTPGQYFSILFFVLALYLAWRGIRHVSMAHSVSGAQT